MHPNLRDRDKMLIEHAPNGNPVDYAGKICVLLLDGESMIKRVYISTNGQIELRPDNPYTRTIFVKPSDELTIHGWVVALVERKNL